MSSVTHVGGNMVNEVVKEYPIDLLELYINENGISTLAIPSKKTIQTSHNAFDSDILDQKLKSDFLEDVDIPENESQEVTIKKVKRYQALVNRLKLVYGCCCQICGATFLMDNGNYYCEAHHIKELSKGGSQNPSNVILLCPNHHRLFHYAHDMVHIDENIIDYKRKVVIGSKTYVINYNKPTPPFNIIP